MIRVPHLKKQAEILKNEVLAATGSGLTQATALEIVSKLAGFANWRHAAAEDATTHYRDACTFLAVYLGEDAPRYATRLIDCGFQLSENGLEFTRRISKPVLEKGVENYVYQFIIPAKDTDSNSPYVNMDCTWLRGDYVTETALYLAASMQEALDASLSDADAQRRVARMAMKDQGAA